MEMQPVSSSNIAAIGFNSETNTLRVEFNNGGVYDYESSQQEYEEILNASSVGSYFHRNIKGRSFIKRA
jgi:hypothetical protein